MTTTAKTTVPEKTVIDLAKCHTIPVPRAMFVCLIRRAVPGGL